MAIAQAREPIPASCLLPTWNRSVIPVAMLAEDGDGYCAGAGANPGFLSAPHVEQVRHFERVRVMPQKFNFLSFKQAKPIHLVHNCIDPSRYYFS
jgi:hypothetical protein